MRPIEIMLLLANLLTFIALAVPLPSAVSWMRHCAPIMLLIAFGQLLLEGPRWQMVPAYVLAALFFVIRMLVVGIDQPGAAASVVFPDRHQIAGLSKTQMDPLTQQSVSPAEKAPLLNGQTFKDGIIPYFAQDVSFTLAYINNTDPNNILTRKLDMQRAGMFGVSFGGIVGAEACLKEPRLKACLVMDVFMTADVVQKGLQQPSMWITRDVPHRFN